MTFNSRICAAALTLGMAAVPVLPAVAQPLRPLQDRNDQYGQGQNRQDDQNRDRGDQDRNRNGQNDNRDRNDNRWANNKYYKMGQKDAEKDRRHNRHEKHNRKFKNDEDRRAYEAGYGNDARGPR